MDITEVLGDLFADRYSTKVMPSNDMHEGIDDHDETPALLIQAHTTPLRPPLHVICLGGVIYLYNGYRPLGRWDLDQPTSLNLLVAAVDAFYAAAGHPKVAA